MAQSVWRAPNEGIWRICPKIVDWSHYAQNIRFEAEEIRNSEEEEDLVSPLLTLSTTSARRRPFIDRSSNPRSLDHVASNDVHRSLCWQHLATTSLESAAVCSLFHVCKQGRRNSCSTRPRRKSTSTSRTRSRSSRRPRHRGSSGEVSHPNVWIPFRPWPGRSSHPSATSEVLCAPRPDASYHTRPRATSSSTAAHSPATSTTTTPLRRSPGGQNRPPKIEIHSNRRENRAERPRIS